MNKYILIGLLLISIPAFATYEPGKCADSNGDLLTTVTGAKYCQSKIAMNWWSAHAWCQSIAAELIDINEDCKNGTGSTVQCPHLYGIGGTERVWTQNVPSATHAYCVNLSVGSVYRSANTIRYESNSYYALCRLGK